MATTDKIEGLQVARALAAISVMIWHSNLMIDWIPNDQKFPLPFFSRYGYGGVWLFFLISGFIIAKSLSSPSFSPGVFMTRRILRIYPLYIIATLAALVLQIWGGIMFHRPDPSWQFIAASLFILPMPAPNAPFYQVGWTLEHEIVFYLLAVAIFAFSRRLELIVAALLAFGLYGLLKGEKAHFLLHLTSPYQLLFAAGMLLFLVREPLRRAGSLFPMAVFLVSAYVLATNWSLSQIERLALDTLASTTLCLALINFKFERLPKLPAKAWRAMVYLGEISFSIYLVHWFVFRLVWRANVLLRPALDDHAELVRWTGIILSIIASILVYRWIEKPMMRLGRATASPQIKAQIAA
ncbi:acyltransferase family protein [Brucella sp. IR073]|uniref:acyltransferase family protein n=1 Tax=unclassified Brucella TaxID=2632610 RepID=UPI003B97D590